MPGYRPPIADIIATLDVAGLDNLLALSEFDHVDRSIVESVLTEFARLAEEVLAPTDRPGDRKGSTFDASSGSVAVPEEFHKAYGQFVEGGWAALASPQKWGGGGFPALVGLAIQEMFTSANVALSLNPALTQSAIELLLRWGSESQQTRFLPRLLTGEWSGTMNLTEPEAGSDLGEVRTIAEPDGDRWLVTGTKVFTTWGEHDLTANIIHMVLARTPGAPNGTHGLSIFLVPKNLLDDAGNVFIRNAMKCTRVEEKLGIHSSPTCVLEFNSAEAELVGPLHGGMRAMFTMMNAARLAIGLQGPSIGELAYQQALDYAHTRRQGSVAGAAGSRRALIIDHPDVRRMLMTMRVLTVASRMLIYTTTGYRDLGRHGTSESARTVAQEYVDLLTPVAKAWSTDVGVAVASLGIQVLGGIGYVEETGMAQRWRDSRIAPIYEGTNGIQAIDLVTRKVPWNRGRRIRELIGEMEPRLEWYGSGDSLSTSLDILEEALDALRTTTDWILQRTTTATNDVLAGASAYLELLGICTGGWLMIRRAVLARGTAAGAGSMLESDFYAVEILARASGLVLPITAGSKRLEGVAQD